jgi:methylthioribose-1-phosphate isomerase
MTTRTKTNRTIWLKESDKKVVQIIDQRFLPHQVVIKDLKNVDEVVVAIRDMQVRGAPLIGVAAGFGMYLASLHLSCGNCSLQMQEAGKHLKDARPTAVNLAHVVDRVLSAVSKLNNPDDIQKTTFQMAQDILNEDVQICKQIGEHGLHLIEDLSKKKNGEAVNVLTHCNAGWLACVEWGTATSPIYHALEQGIKVHVWVDETRPRRQGAHLTAWELGERGVPHTLISDNSSGYLMTRGLVDLVLVGTDRTTVTGDVANKIGTYMVALAAKDNQVPFYVSAPSSSIDWNMTDGFREIPIEKRSENEVKEIQGWCDGTFKKVKVAPERTPALNYAFDVTPRALVTGIITERGIAEARKESLLKLFPEKRGSI